jgi:D-glycero-alpha-D-manno-heptose-7-phosphate kinase
MLIRARAPLRLGLGGGGTDVAPYCDLHGGMVLNATIDKYAYSTIEPSADGRVYFVAADLGLDWEGKAQDKLPLDGKLNLHKGVYNRVMKDFWQGEAPGLRLFTLSDAPPGSGLGSSSTLVVAMLTAFVEFLNLPLGDYDIARYAYEIERIDVGLGGGKQDQYAATFGGFNFMEFYAEDRVVVNPLRIKQWVISELEASLMLYNTGISRESANIIIEQSNNVRRSDQEAITAMHHVKQEAIVFKESVLKGDFGAIAQCLENAWEAKKKMASKISNPHIEHIRLLAKEAGAYAAKISGAGGGGFMMLLVDPIRRRNVAEALMGQGGQVVDFHFTKHGAHAWRVG